jgi:tRNA pseudouridine38-40 synthase
MVRTIAGTLIDVGRDGSTRRSSSEPSPGGSRELLGPTAPPGGLYLVSVQYEERAFARPEPAPHGAPACSTRLPLP